MGGFSLLFFVLFSAVNALAGEEICRITPNNSLAEEVLPTLRELFPEIRATVAGGKILSMANTKECALYKRALSEIDRPRKKFRVSFRWESEGDSTRSGGRIGRTSKGPELQVVDSGTAEQARSAASLQVIEGQRAQWIESGDKYQGWSFVIRGLNKDRAQLQVFHGAAGSSHSSTETTMELSLGQWTPMSQSEKSESFRNREILGRENQRLESSKRLLIRID
jgi:hypothetical protein